MTSGTTTGAPVTSATASQASRRAADRPGEPLPASRFSAAAPAVCAGNSLPSSGFDSAGASQSGPRASVDTVLTLRWKPGVGRRRGGRAILISSDSRSASAGESARPLRFSASCTPGPVLPQRRQVGGGVRAGDAAGRDVVRDPVDPATRVSHRGRWPVRGFHGPPVQPRLRIVRAALPGQGRVELHRRVLQQVLGIHPQPVAPVPGRRAEPVEQLPLRRRDRSAPAGRSRDRCAGTPRTGPRSGHPREPATAAELACRVRVRGGATGSRVRSSFGAEMRPTSSGSVVRPRLARARMRCLTGNTAPGGCYGTTARRTDP